MGREDGFTAEGGNPFSSLDMFHKFGRVKDVQIVIDKKTNKSRGFAFVYFDEVESAIRVSDQLTLDALLQLSLSLGQRSNERHRGGSSSFAYRLFRDQTGAYTE